MNNILPSFFGPPATTSNSQGGGSVYPDSLPVVDNASNGQQKGLLGKNFSDVFGGNKGECSSRSPDANTLLNVEASSSFEKEGNLENIACANLGEETGESSAPILQNRATIEGLVKNSLVNEMRLFSSLARGLGSSEVDLVSSVSSEGADVLNAARPLNPEKVENLVSTVVADVSDLPNERPSLVNGDKANISVETVSFEGRITEQDSASSDFGFDISSDRIPELFSDLFGEDGLSGSALPDESISKMSDAFRKVRQTYESKPLSYLDSEELEEPIEDPNQVDKSNGFSLTGFVEGIEDKIGLSSIVKPISLRLVTLDEASDDENSVAEQFVSVRQSDFGRTIEATETDFSNPPLLDSLHFVDRIEVPKFVRDFKLQGGRSDLVYEPIVLPLTSRSLFSIGGNVGVDSISSDHQDAVVVSETVSFLPYGIETAENMPSVLDSKLSSERIAKDADVASEGDSLRDAMSLHSDSLFSLLGLVSREIESSGDQGVVVGGASLGERTVVVSGFSENVPFSWSNQQAVALGQEVSDLPEHYPLEGEGLRLTDVSAGVLSEYLPVLHDVEYTQNASPWSASGAPVLNEPRELATASILSTQPFHSDYLFSKDEFSGIEQSHVSKVAQSPLPLEIELETLGQGGERALEPKESVTVNTPFKREDGSMGTQEKQVEDLPDNVISRSRTKFTESVEVEKNISAKPEGRVSLQEQEELSHLASNSNPQAIGHREKSLFSERIGMPVANQLTAMKPKVQRAPKSQNSSQQPIALPSRHVASDMVRGHADALASFEFASSLDDAPFASSHFPSERHETVSEHGKDIISVPQRAQSSSDIVQTKQTSFSKMRSDSLPSVPDLNPRLLRQLEQFQRSQRPWAKVSLSMNEGDDLMLRMKVSSGRVQIRFGTQSMALREGIERGWSELIHRAASLGIQLDAPEFETRLRARGSGFEGMSLSESLNGKEEGSLKSNRRKTVSRHPMGSDEPIEDYPKVLKWA